VPADTLRHWVFWTRTSQSPRKENEKRRIRLDLLWPWFGVDSEHPQRKMLRWLSWFCGVVLVVNVSMAWTPPVPLVKKEIFFAGKVGEDPIPTGATAPSTPNMREQDKKVIDDARRVIGRSLLSIPLMWQATSRPSNAAPPMSVMMEELGYFPVRDDNNGATSGEVVYVPARIQRESSQQAIALAKYLQKENISMAGAYWCPHCRRQRELFGKEAWAIIPYRECASQGYQHQNCPSQVSGYPTWLKGRRGEVVASGELPLAVLAEKVGFRGFDDSLEQNVPPMIGASSCGK
jgi:Zn ribbon nucleic-acid-binding protein